MNWIRFFFVLAVPAWLLRYPVQWATSKMIAVPMPTWLALIIGGLGGAYFFCGLMPKRNNGAGELAGLLFCAIPVSLFLLAWILVTSIVYIMAANPPFRTGACFIWWTLTVAVILWGSCLLTGFKVGKK
ncbi:MAG TPA: hypothetical protein P5267_03330 [Patescibacteria group bacterium]|nr:hypothetical protein [Patescibacteria group bacterium]